MPPRSRKQIGKGKSPERPALDLGDITLEEKKNPTTLHEVPRDILRQSLKKTDYASFMRSVSSSKLFQEALNPAEHPEHVSHLYALESTQRKTIGEKITLQESTDSCPTLQRVSYGVSKGFYIYDPATNQSKKYTTGNDNDTHTIKKTAFSTDGTMVATVDNLNDLRLWKYDPTTQECTLVKVYENDVFAYHQTLKLTMYQNHVFILILTSNDTFMVFQTTAEPTSSFTIIHNEDRGGLNFNRIAVHNEKIILTTSIGFKAYVLKPKPHTAVFQLSMVPWNQKSLPTNTIPHYATFDATGTSILTVYSTGLIQTMHSQTNGLHLWKWETNNNTYRFEYVKELPTAIVITEKDRALWRMAAFSPNGRYVAALSFARSPDIQTLYKTPCIDLWEVASGRHVRTIYIKAKGHAVKQVVLLGFYKKDQTDSIFCIDAAFQVYAFSPDLSFSGGRRKQIGKGKSPVGDAAARATRAARK